MNRLGIVSKTQDHDTCCGGPVMQMKRQATQMEMSSLPRHTKCTSIASVAKSGLVRRRPCRDTHGRCVRTSSVTAPHHQAVSPREGIKNRQFIRNLRVRHSYLLASEQQARVNT
jgi:hypothetical protein